MDNGPTPSKALIWVMGMEFNDELLAGLARAVEAGYDCWVFIPALQINYRPSTGARLTGTLGPHG